MTGFDPGLERACREALDAVAGPDDRAAALALVGLLRWSTHEVAMWFAAAAIALAEGLTDDQLASVTSRRMPEPGVVAGIVRALRSQDMNALREIAGDDSAGLSVALAVAAASMKDDSGCLGMN